MTINTPKYNNKLSNLKENFNKNTLEQVLDTQKNTDLILDNYSSHLKEMDNMLDDIKSMNLNMMEVLLLVKKYIDKNENFNYNNDKDKLDVKNNLLFLLKELRIDITRINFAMLEEYEKNRTK